MSRRPTGCRVRRSLGSRSKTVRRPFSSLAVVITPLGLFSRIACQESFCIGFPSTVNLSFSGETRYWVSCTVRPFTCRRPFSIQSLVWLREAAPSFESARSSGTFP